MLENSMRIANDFKSHRRERERERERNFFRTVTFEAVDLKKKK